VAVDCAQLIRATFRDTGFTCATQHVRMAAEWLGLLQWPAMAVTLVAAWQVGSRARGRREAGFWCFVASNLLWVAWGWHDRAGR
jgi:hypothetical protein